MSYTAPTLFQINASVQAHDPSDIPALNALIFDMVTGQYRLGDGVNPFATLAVASFGSKEVVVPVTGFTHTIWATRTLLHPAAALATGTFALPAEPYDGQRIVISSSATITTVAWTIPSGQAMVYEPTTLVAGTPISLIWDAATAKWYQAE